MTDGTPPSSYWEPPEPTAIDALEEGEDIAKHVMSDWADGGYTVAVDVRVSRGLEPVLTVSYVETEAGMESWPNAEFDTEEELRAWLLEQHPLPAEED